MAYRCDICGKGPKAGKNVSHSNRHTVRTFNPNLAVKTLYFGSTPRRGYVCMTCIKSGKAKLHPPV